MASIPAPLPISASIAYQPEQLRCAAARHFPALVQDRNNRLSIERLLRAAKHAHALAPNDKRAGDPKVPRPLFELSLAL